MSSCETALARDAQRGVGGQEPIALLLVGEAMAGDQHHADVAAGHLLPSHPSASMTLVRVAVAVDERLHLRRRE